MEKVIGSCLNIGGCIMENNIHMPQFPEPAWRSSVELPKFQKLEENMEADICIVGAGITGITTAYLLSQAGLKVILIEAGSILNGTTGHTTAKITAQHDLIYDELIAHIGEEKAKLYYQANHEAIRFIENLVKEHQIDCDLKRQDAYLYTNSDVELSKLEKEMTAYQKLGIENELVTDIPLNLEMKAALVMKNQAQFHPLKYLNVLLNKFIEAGGLVFEQTTAVDILDEMIPKVVTEKGHTISCKYIIAASHFPFYDVPGLYFTRMYAERSYVLAVKMDEAFPDGMYLSVEEPKRSLRSANINGEELVLIGGQSHKTGQGISTILHYEALQEYAQDTFSITNIPYRWSAQDYITLDKIPYVGQLTNNHENILIATGFRKWGMTNGTASALLLTDIVLGKENRYLDVFTTSRFHADPSVKTFLRENMNVAKELISGKVEFPLRKIADLANDQGAVVNVNGKRAGAYKDSEGNVYLVDTTCKHLGCEVEWNSGDRTWDCPCHGSRYSIEGEVIDGPAKKPLDRVENE